MNVNPRLTRIINSNVTLTTNWDEHMLFTEQPAKSINKVAMNLAGNIIIRKMEHQTNTNLSMT